MAMNGNVLGAALKDALTITPNDGESMDAYRTRLFSAMGAAIVQHITTYAEVNAQVTVNSVTAVSPGPGVSGPGTGMTIPTPGQVT